MSKRSYFVGAALAGIAGTSLASVSVLMYIRFADPQEFADGTIRASNPEVTDAFNRKWGVYGTGIFDSIPQSIKDFFVIPDMAEKIKEQNRKREQQIQQTIEDLRPKK